MNTAAIVSAVVAAIIATTRLRHIRPTGQVQEKGSVKIS